MEQRNEVKSVRPHSLTVEARKKAVLSGIDKVVSMTETAVQLISSVGGISISGSGMHMVKFSAEEGIMAVEGTIDKIQYVGGENSGSLLKKLFK